MPYIYYLIHLKKNIIEIQALMNLKRKIIAIIQLYIIKLGFKVWFINIRVLKIDNSILDIICILLGDFKLKISLKIPGFFKKPIW